MGNAPSMSDLDETGSERGWQESFIDHGAAGYMVHHYTVAVICGASVFYGDMG